MFQNRFRKKANQPNGGDSSLELSDISGEVPEIDDVLSDIDAAIQVADDVKKKAKGRWVECCGVRRWEED